MIHYKSHFICDCGCLIYVDVKTKKEFCLNSSCKHFVNETIKDNTTEVEMDFRKLKSKLKLEIRSYDRNALIGFLFVEREKLLENYFSSQPIDFNSFFAINELIMITNQSFFNGRKRVDKHFYAFFDKFQKLIRDEIFLSDLKSKTFIKTENRTLSLKYYEAFFEVLENYGISTVERIARGQPFKYNVIDAKKNNNKPLMTKEIIDYYKQFYTTMISINYLLNKTYRNIEIYKYDFNAHDIALLLSIYFSLNSSISETSNIDFKKHLSANTDNEKEHHHFINNFSLKNDQAPIFFKKQNSFLFGKATTHFFAFYLIGLHSKDMMREERQLASSVFESDIRSKLREKGYAVPFDKEFSLSNNTYGYDVIAISETKREILLIEVKYQDIAPSSMNGINLIRNVLDGENGLLSVAEKQHKRLEFFKNNLQEFSKQLNLELSSFSFEPFVVTKFTPLIFEASNIKVVSYDEFLKLV